MTMKGIDLVTAASIISCIGDIKKFPTSAKLARYSGIAPISNSSGKYDLQYATQSGNREVNSLIYQLAVRLTSPTQGKIINPFFYEYFHRKQSEGKTKRQAFKCVMRRLVNILWAMMTYGEDYINPPTCSLPKEKETPPKKKTKHPSKTR
jgi:transposase